MSKYPTFYDEIIAAVPMDRWVTTKHIANRMLIRGNGIKKRYVKCCMERGVKRGHLISRDTGIRKAYKYDPIFPVYEYMRVVEGRAVASVPHNARKPCRNKGYNTDTPVKIKKVRVSKRKKLSDDQVRQIRFLYALGNTSMDQLAKMFNLSTQAISKIIDRTHYKYVRD